MNRKELLGKRSYKITVIAVETLRHQRPDLFVETDTYAIECALHEICGLPHPRKPSERKQEGAAKRGRELAGKPALNPAGRLARVAAPRRQAAQTGERKTTEALARSGVRHPGLGVVNCPAVAAFLRGGNESKNEEVPKG